mgnify:CR=1 FL=1
MSDEKQILFNEQKKFNLKEFFISNKKTIIALIIIIFTCLFIAFFYLDYKKSEKIKISEQYNFAIINYIKTDSEKTILEMKKIIDRKDPTYSPLAFYFLLDNDLLNNKNEINRYFDTLINDISLDTEIKNLIIYKKGLYNSDTANEEEILSIFKPLINSDNLWKSHTLFIIAEYYYSKNQMQKSKEFFEKILTLENSNPQIRLEAQKRLQRDFSA